MKLREYLETLSTEELSSKIEEMNKTLNVNGSSMEMVDMYDLAFGYLPVEDRMKISIFVMLIIHLFSLK